MESFLHHAGYIALVVLAFVEACCVPIPSEVTFGFAGVLAAEGRLDLVLVIVLGSLAELAGSFVAWGIGRAGGRPLVHRLGRYVLLTPSDLDRAERWFARRGALAVPVGRAMPFVRAFTSVVAGTAEIPALRFGVLSAIGTTAYAAALSGIGYAAAGAWSRVARDVSVAGYGVAAAVVVAVAAGIVLRVREPRKQRVAPSVPVTDR